MPPGNEPPETKGEDRTPEVPLHYHLCPECARAVPAQSDERYCVNDGARLLSACPGCSAAITSPYSRYCSGCGRILKP